ncbi:MAG: hypothetical protein H6835_14260 [Planctomycetes bacterium]|nr:hypothetical protein [Planctomycetota bacterium]
MKKLTLCAYVLFLLAPLMAFLPAPGVCDAEAWPVVSEGGAVTWEMHCISDGCLKECVKTQLGNPVGPDVPMGCVCPPLNGNATCASVFFHRNIEGTSTIVSGRCRDPLKSCGTAKVCTNIPQPDTSVLPIPVWDACDCK